MLQTAIRPKVCESCGTSFMPFLPMARACSVPCALKMSRAETKRRIDAKKAEKAQDKQRAAAIEPIRELVKAAQKEFNAFIRERDRDQPCISCGVVNPPEKAGGAWDAGHFLSRGAHPELRFDETNCHKQCKSCNAGSGKFARHARTVQENYAANLPDRIGIPAYERLIGPHEVCKLDRDVLRQIKTIYRAKTKQLKKEQQ